MTDKKVFCYHLAIPDAEVRIAIAVDITKKIGTVELDGEGIAFAARDDQTAMLVSAYADGYNDCWKRWNAVLEKVKSQSTARPVFNQMHGVN